MRCRITANLHIWILLMLAFFGSSVFCWSTTPSDYDTVIRQTILKTVKRNLPARSKAHAHAITSTIMFQAAKYKLDPYIITAVIQGESSFNPRAIGSRGEIGLMQLRESTAIWISKKIKMAWLGKKSLQDPLINIRLGTAYLSYLRKKLGKQGHHYLAAYNMGFVSVSRILAKNQEPQVYSKHVMKRYLSLNEKGSLRL